MDIIDNFENMNDAARLAILASLFFALATLWIIIEIHWEKK